jgi:hypothetical protein
MQNNLLANNKQILKRIFTNNLIKLSFNNFSAKLNINFSHMPNDLPHEGLNIDNKKNLNSYVTLNDLLLSKLSKNKSNFYI